MKGTVIDKLGNLSDKCLLGIVLGGEVKLDRVIAINNSKPLHRFDSKLIEGDSL